MPWITPEGQQAALPAAIHTCDSEQMPELHLLLPHNALLLNFSSAADGRAFSWCARLRRLGYAGPVAAGGELGLDRIAYAFRCGFSLAWLSEAEIPLLKPIHITPFSHLYQQAYETRNTQ